VLSNLGCKAKSRRKSISEEKKKRRVRTSPEDRPLLKASLAKMPMRPKPAPESRQ
jgi:hypothetical protein